MYSNEISEILCNNNYEIDSKTYINILKNSSQINHIIYEPFDDYYEMWDCFGSYFRFKIFFKR